MMTFGDVIKLLEVEFPSYIFRFAGPGRLQVYVDNNTGQHRWVGAISGDDLGEAIVQTNELIATKQLEDDYATGLKARMRKARSKP